MKVKKYICIALTLITLVSLLSGCSGIKVPNVLGKNEKQAVELIEKAGLVPIVEYEYREKEEKGKVFKTNPGLTSVVKSGSEVLIYISKGPERIIAKNAYSRWISYGKSEESWNFNLPYVDKDVLYIDCYKVILKDGVTWQESQEEGVALAQVSLTEDFEKTVTAKVKYEKGYVAAFEEQSFVIGIPMEELGVEKPELLCLRLDALKDENPEEINQENYEEKVRIDFSVEW